MKKIATLFLAVSMALAVSSCKKDDDNNSTPANNTGGSNLTKTEILTGRTWKITELTVDGQSQVGTLVTACDLDDIYQFKANGEFIVDEGATKCDPTDPQIETQSTWKFLDNETKLEADGEVATITELTTTKLVTEGTLGTAKVVLTYAPW